jgi:EAL domain-containing protein (putative c-di-GMP-specific phosphodiesterase class I)
MMRAFADLAAFEIDREHEATKAANEREGRIRAVIGANQISIVYQPIWDIETRLPVGVECLSRFSATPSRSPDRWFAEAAETGLGILLELAAIRIALPALAVLPSHAYLAVNASPQTVLDSAFASALEGFPAERIVLELTEHANVEDYDELFAALQPLRERGVKIAIDDAGAGYSSLRHILYVRPDVIKLDISLTRNINLDPARKALAAALIGFAHETGSQIVAEGVETAAELATLQTLGADKAQGYWLSHPLPLSDVATIFDKGRASASRVA